MDARDIFSFASGQSPLPTEILDAVVAGLRPVSPNRLSDLELPFTSDDARAIMCGTEQLIRELLRVPPTHEIVFMQGGAYAQFGIVAMNLGGPARKAAYVQAGHWSRRAAHEAAPWIDVHAAAEGDGTSLPLPEIWDVPQPVTYCHYTTNESVEGLQFPTLPSFCGVPTIADMTADFLMRPVDFANIGLLYASSQKNLGIAGLTVVIAAQTVLDRCAQNVPAPFRYDRQVREGSRVNTPPLFAIAVAGHVCRWLRDRGGLAMADARSKERAELLYGLIARDGFYHSPVDPQFRSRVSVRFHLPSPELEAMFLTESRKQGLLYLQGHSSVGGLRASLYNLVPIEAVRKLADFMQQFERAYG